MNHFSRVLTDLHLLCYFSGFLYGRYEQFPDVPLGIKAVVSAIYEPPQEGTRDGVKLEPAQPETEAELAALASNLGLQRVGWMFTDLIPSSDGQVKHFRNIDTYFLSSQACTLWCRKRREACAERE